MNSFSKIKINYAFSVRTRVLAKNKLKVFEKWIELHFTDEFVYQVFLVSNILKQPYIHIKIFFIKEEFAAYKMWQS